MLPIPVIINNCNLLTWPKAMVARIKRYRNVGEIIIVDNGSTYPPLLDWYETKPCTVLKYPNIGHGAPWSTGTVSKLGVKYYVVTDSDLGLDDTPDDTLDVLYDKLEHYPAIKKLGLGLESESVVSGMAFYTGLAVYERERWMNSVIVDGIYVDVCIDTTFALYCEPKSGFGGGSLNWPYMAKHYPYHYTLEAVQSDPEFLYYLQHANASSTCKKVLLP